MKVLIIHARSAISWALLDDLVRVDIALQDLSTEQLGDLAQAAKVVAQIAESLAVAKPPKEDHGVIVLKWEDVQDPNTSPEPTVEDEQQEIVEWRGEWSDGDIGWPSGE